MSCTGGAGRPGEGPARPCSLTPRVSTSIPGCRPGLFEQWALSEENVSCPLVGRAQVRGAAARHAAHGGGQLELPSAGRDGHGEGRTHHSHGPRVPKASAGSRGGCLGDAGPRMQGHEERHGFSTQGLADPLFRRARHAEKRADVQANRPQGDGRDTLVGTRCMPIGDACVAVTCPTLLCHAQLKAKLGPMGIAGMTAGRGGGGGRGERGGFRGRGRF